MPSFEGPKKPQNNRRLSSGIEELDHILGGGFPVNRLFLIEGAPGTGKTTLALQFLLEGAKHSEAGLYVTFSESDNEVRSVADSHGWNLDGVHLQELSKLGDCLLSEEQYTVFQPADVELSQTTQRVIDEVRRLSPKRVVIDSLSEIRLVAHDPLRYRRQIMALKEILSECDCTVLFLEDHTLGNSDLLLQSIAHGVVLLDRLQAEYGGVRRKLQVTKMRGGPWLEGMHDFVIRPEGLQVFRRLVAADSINHEIGRAHV
jgi:circadian clock protein KaiC